MPVSRVAQVLQLVNRYHKFQEIIHELVEATIALAGVTTPTFQRFTSIHPSAETGWREQLQLRR